MTTLYDHQVVRRWANTWCVCIWARSKLAMQAVRIQCSEHVSKNRKLKALLKRNFLKLLSQLAFSLPYPKLFDLSDPIFKPTIVCDHQFFHMWRYFNFIILICIWTAPLIKRILSCTHTTGDPWTRLPFSMKQVIILITLKENQIRF